MYTVILLICAVSLLTKINSAVNLMTVTREWLHVLMTKRDGKILSWPLWDKKKNEISNSMPKKKH